MGDLINKVTTFYNSEHPVFKKAVAKAIVKDKLGEYHVLAINLNAHCVLAHLFSVRDKTSNAHCHMSYQTIDGGRFEAVDLDEIVVHKNFSGRGLGKLMLALLMEFVSKSGPTKFKLMQDPTIEKSYTNGNNTNPTNFERNYDYEFLTKNKHKQDAIYEKLGFKVVGEAGLYTFRETKVYPKNQRFTSYCIEQDNKVHNKVCLSKDFNVSR